MMETSRWPKASYSVLSIARGRDPQARSGVAIDDQIGLRRLVLLVGGDIAQLGQRLELCHHLVGPRRQLLGVSILQAELILRAADAVFHRQVLHRLHVERDAFDAGDLLLQPLHDGGHVIVAVVARLQVDLYASAVGRGVGAVHADERRQAHHVLVLQDCRRQVALPFGHGGKRYALRRIGDAHDDAGVLHREEAFGHHDVHDRWSAPACRW